MGCAGRYKRPQMRSRSRELLAAVGLADHANHRPGQLSGGQQQRVAIARALACSPRLVLADEPTAALDTDTAAAIMDLLVALNQQERVTILCSTHDPRLLPYMRRQVHLEDGRIVRDVRDARDVSGGRGPGMALVAHS